MKPLANCSPARWILMVIILLGLIGSKSFSQSSKYTITLTDIQKYGDADIYGEVGVSCYYAPNNYVQSSTGQTNLCLWRRDQGNGSRETPNTIATFTAEDRFASQGAVRIWFRIKESDSGPFGGKDDEFFLTSLAGFTNGRREFTSPNRLDCCPTCTEYDYVDVPFAEFYDAQGNIGNGATFTCKEGSDGATFAFTFKKEAIKLSCAQKTATDQIIEKSKDAYHQQWAGPVTGNIAAGSNRNTAFGDGYFYPGSKNGAVYYYPCKVGRAVAVWGDIMQKWGTTDWERGPLGWPADDHKPAVRDGAFTFFQGGAIYYSPNNGSHIVWGAIRDTWVKAGAENTQLGYPKTDEIEVKGKYFFIPEAGVYQEYEGGRIYYKWDAGRQAFSVRGKMLEKYLQAGGSNGFYGWPTGEAQPQGNGWRQPFENGAIVL